MITINLETELIKTNEIRIEKELASTNALLDSAKDVLNQKSSDDIRLLKQYGMESSMNSAKDIQQKKSDLDISRTNKRVFSEKDIRSIAIKYGLRFLSSRLYQGSFPADLPQKIREAENDIENSGLRTENNEYGGEKAMILAPKENFQLQERPKDPLFFIPLSNGDYYLAHKWGDDLNIGRRVKYFLPNLFGNHMWFAVGLMVTIISLLPLNIYGNHFFKATSALSATVTFVILMLSGLDVPFILSSTPKNNWTSPYK